MTVKSTRYNTDRGGQKHIRRLCAIIALCFAASMAMAQDVYEKPRHKGGDFYIGIAGGFSQSLAENAVNTDFISHQIPSTNVMIGYNFTKMFGLRLTGGLNAQTSRCSEVAHNALPELYGSGRYGFKTLTGTLSAVVNVTNMFFDYNPDRVTWWSFLLGGGYLKSFGFDKEKINKWNTVPYYPVDPNGGGYASGHVGVQCAARVSEPFDVQVEVRANATDNRYNGVSNGNHLDFYVDAMINFVYHFKNSQKLYRFRPPMAKPYVDPVLRDEAILHEETFRNGDVMYTVIPFYAGFNYLNDVSRKRIGRVADFLQKNEGVNITIVGHPDVIGENDDEYNRQLGEKRAKTVFNTLVEEFGVDESRLKISYDDMPLQSFKSIREWVPSVSFVMEQAGK